MTFDIHIYFFVSLILTFYKSTMTFLCQTCGKNFGSKAKLNTHKQIHSEKVLICKICDKTLIGIKSFNNHIKIHQTYECTICEATIKLNSKTAHMKLCSNVESKKFTCKECLYVVAEFRIQKWICKGPKKDPP